MTDEEKDIWVSRLQAVGNMGVATVLVVALSSSHYLDSASRNESNMKIAKATEESVVMLEKIVALRDKEHEYLNRIITLLENQ